MWLISYGVEEDGLSSTENGVTVSTNTFTLNEDHLLLLQLNVNPLSDSSNYGKDLFLHTLQEIIHSYPEEYREYQ